MQTNTYLAGQKTAKKPQKTTKNKKQKHNGPNQITPSKEGASEGLHAVEIALILRVFCAVIYTTQFRGLWEGSAVVNAIFGSSLRKQRRSC